MTRPPVWRRLTAEWLENRLAPNAGTLDPSFGTDGLVTFDQSPRHINQCNAVVALADGSVLLAGSALSTTSEQDFAVAKLTPAGALDPSFGANGVAILPLAGEAFGLAIQTDGKIVACGDGTATSVSGSAGVIAVVRLTATGSLDSSFGTGGTATVAAPAGYGGLLGMAVALQADGKIVVAGQAMTQAPNPVHSDYIIARLTATGGLDTGFGTGGTQIVAFDAVTDNFDTARAVFIRSSGEIVVAGRVNPAGVFGAGFGYEFGVAQLTSTGELDTAFGTGGKVALADSLDDSRTAAALQPDGALVLAGNVGEAQSQFFTDCEVTRLTATGARDTSFGTASKTIVSFDAGTSVSFGASGVDLQADGKIIVTGVAGSSTSPNTFAAARLTAAGALDPTYGTGGKVTVAFPNGLAAAASAVAAMADGRAVLAGVAHDQLFSTQPFAAARLLGDSAPASPPTSPVTVGPPGLPDATAGQAYTQTLTASGPPGAAAFTVSAGTLPAGLTLDGGTGTLAGTPTTAGTYTFTITATIGAATGSQGYTLTVDPAAVLPPPAPPPPAPPINPPPATLPPVTPPPVLPPPVVTSPPVPPVPPPTPISPPPASPPPAPVHLTAQSVPAGHAPDVTVYNPDGSVRFTLAAFEGQFTGGVAIAVGDVTGDEVDDVIVGAGDGGGPRVRVFDGATGAVVADFFAFEPEFRGGVSVAAGPGGEVVAGAGVGGAPRVRVFRPSDGSALADFFAFDPGLRGGVSVGTGDVTGDGVPDVVIGAGVGGGPVVRVFDGANGADLGSFLAGPSGDRTGVEVRVRDLAVAGQNVVATRESGRVRVFAPLTGTDLTNQFDPALVNNLFVG